MKFNNKYINYNKLHLPALELKKKFKCQKFHAQLCNRLESCWLLGHFQLGWCFSPHTLLPFPTGCCVFCGTVLVDRGATVPVARQLRRMPASRILICASLDVQYPSIPTTGVFITIHKYRYVEYWWNQNILFASWWYRTLDEPKLLELLSLLVNGN